MYSKRMRFDLKFAKPRTEGFPKNLCHVTVVKQMFERLDFSFKKEYKGESVILNLNIFSFVKTILFNTLYWNSLILVSIVTIKGKE